MAVALLIPQKSIVQFSKGSAVGPPLFLLSGGDLKPLSKQNFLDKYADDMYLIVPSSNENTVTSELDNIEKWCTKSNLKLNYSKSKELVFFQ